MILRNGELLSFQNGIMRYHYCEFSKNGENSKNDDLPTVWKFRPSPPKFSGIFIYQKSFTPIPKPVSLNTQTTPKKKKKKKKGGCGEIKKKK
ncbi:hypothetical protein, partial [Escherichia coli]|uniref:hypothetical protein n=1 Tax=Escherichia coli TaxID=562 RepID=UPI001BB07D68